MSLWNNMGMDKYKNRKVVLVDLDDREIGVAPLIEAHRDGGLKHRAFSLILINKVGNKVKILLQRRALSKPVFPGYWANTCCYNLAPGEEYLERARSRVKEEMGIDLGDGPLSILYKFSYEAEGLNGWCENEVDTVIIGEWMGKVVPNLDEVVDYKWLEWEEMKVDMQNNPDIYSPWWKMIVNEGRVEKYIGE